MINLLASCFSTVTIGCINFGHLADPPIQNNLQSLQQQNKDYIYKVKPGQANDGSGRLKAQTLKRFSVKDSKGYVGSKDVFFSV